MGPRAARGPGPEGPALNEGERQVPRPDGLGHAFHREATLLAGPRDANLQDIDGPERRHPPLPRDQDAVGDQPLDLLDPDARPGGQLAATSGLVGEATPEQVQALARPAMALARAELRPTSGRRAGERFLYPPDRGIVRQLRCCAGGRCDRHADCARASAQRSGHLARHERLGRAGTLIATAGTIDGQDQTEHNPGKSIL
jgi:hypothetical protein